MGDCWIRILISKELLSDASSSYGRDDSDVIMTHVDSADATVQDVFHAVLTPLSLSGSFRLWDCTLHPPKDISDWLTLYNETTGPKSKTLYEAGFFPSGKWQVLPMGKEPTQKTVYYDDVQYNLATAQDTTLSTGAVRLLGENKNGMTPSEILDSVAHRLDGESADADPALVLQIRRGMRQAQVVKEASRHAKLEERIRNLSRTTSSSTTVSQQVRRMLIKSRCTGLKSLEMHDRVYLEIVILSFNNDDDESTKEEYQYFSQQDTVARILSTCSSHVQQSSPYETELLVRLANTSSTKGDQTPAIYRRLPITMRLYEALSSNYLQEVDSVVLRCYDPSAGEEPTTSILTQEHPEQHSHEMQHHEAIAALQQDVREEKTSTAPSSVGVEPMGTDDVLDSEVCERLKKTIQAMEDDKSSEKMKKKASTSTSTSAKVRTMLMKSKAKGDAKRVPNMDDRFFVDLVVINDNVDGHACTVVSAFPVFLAKSDPVKRLLRDCLSTNDTGFKATILVPTAEGRFRCVPDGITLNEAESKGYFKSFDRVVVLFSEL